MSNQEMNATMNKNNNVTSSDKVKMMTTAALMTAIICIMGPLSIPIGPVPISLTNLAIYFTMYVLNWKAGTISTALYLLIGLIGLPVFSGFTGGPAKLVGPTGGYLIGFLPMALVVGLILKKFWNKPVIAIVGMEAATWIPYLLGTAWLGYSTGMGFKAAFAAGVAPFIIEDLIKIVLAAIVGPMLKKRVAPIQ